MHFVQGIAITRDQIPGHQRQVRPGFVCHIYGARQFPFAEERAQMNVADLNHPQAMQFGRQSPNRDIDLADMEIVALDEYAVAGYENRRRQCSGPRGG